MSFRIALLCALCTCCASIAHAQVIFEPVQYQYGQGCNVYYYGGSDPRVHYAAMQPSGGGGAWGRVDGACFASGDIDRNRLVRTEPVRTFTDTIPYMNATFYGFTPNDARNEAYANVPTYFRKADLMNAAVPVNGGWVVPAQAQPLRLDERAPSRRPATMPRPLMIFPKDRLQPRPSEKDKTFASSK